MPTRDPAVCQAFVKLTKEALLTRPDLIHSWSIDDDGDHCVLEIPSSSDTGFPVTVDVSPEEITIYAGGFHRHFTCVEPYDALIKDVLGVIRDLLSPIMRIRERSSGGSPYRWDAEMFIRGDWQSDGTTSLFFWNYFGKKSERCLQNNHLKARAYD